MADLAAAFRQREIGTFELVLAMLFFTAFGVKAALFPLFFWFPLLTIRRLQPSARFSRVC